MVGRKSRSIYGVGWNVGKWAWVEMEGSIMVEYADRNKKGEQQPEDGYSKA